jgi:proteasome alpha subunit
MAYSPYDWRQTLQEKASYVEDRLRSGSPVIGISCREGILLLTVRQAQRKLYEVYDRLAFGGLGNPSDLEAVRQAAIDFCHAEGFQRSPEDVSIQRVVGFALSPVLKQGFADPLRTPLVVLGLFAQLGERPEDDLFYKLNFDGEFTLQRHYAGIAGTREVEKQLEETLGEASKRVISWQKALPQALESWMIARWQTQQGEPLRREGEHSRSTSDQPQTKAGSEERLRLPSEKERERLLAEALQNGSVEGALLDRETTRAQRFHLLTEEEVSPFVPAKEG